MKNFSIRHVPRFFSIEEKDFRIKIDDLSVGGSILITEKAKERHFHLSLDLICVRWLFRRMQEVVTSKNQSSFKSLRGDAYQVWMERYSNRSGEYLRVSKCIRGVVKSVIFPRGRNYEGWLLVVEILDGVLSGQTEQSKLKARGEKASWGMAANCSGGNKTYKEAAQIEVVGEGLAEKEAEKEKEVGVKAGMSWWNRAVVCQRTVVHQSWGDIQKTLEGKLNKEVKLIPYQCNRAYFICDCAQEASKVSSSGTLEVEGQKEALMFSWKSGLKGNHPMIVSYGGWLGISGLPLHWWTKEIFQ